MSDYIFKNKTKNITAAVVSALLIISQIYEIIFYIVNDYTASSVLPLIIKLWSVLPYILTLIYLITSSKQYRLKGLLFPIGFLCLAASSAYSVVDCFGGVFNSFEVDLYSLGYAFGAAAFDIILFSAFIICLIGSVDDFAMVKFFKAGTLLLALTNLILPIIAFISVGGFDYIAEAGYSAISYTALLNCVLTVAYYFCLFNLTLNTKRST